MANLRRFLSRFDVLNSVLLLPKPIRSADGAFNAALLLERGDPLTAIASAVGVPMFQEDERYRVSPPSRYLPFRKNYTTVDSPRSAHVGGSRASANRNVAGRDASGLSLDDIGDETTAEGEQQFDGDPSEHLDAAAQKLRRREIIGGAGQQDGKRIGDDVEISDSQRIWGSRPLALRMFQRAAELGHAGAIGEVRRLRLRERMDNLTRAGCRPPARG